MGVPTKNAVIGQFVNGRNAQDDFLQLANNHGGTVFAWIDYLGNLNGTFASIATPGGNNKDVQYNNNGVLGGSDLFTFVPNFPTQTSLEAVSLGQFAATSNFASMQILTAFSGTVSRTYNYGLDIQSQLLAPAGGSVGTLAGLHTYIDGATSLGGTATNLVGADIHVNTGVGFQTNGIGVNITFAGNADYPNCYGMRVQPMTPFGGATVWGVYCDNTGAFFGDGVAITTQNDGPTNVTGAVLTLTNTSGSVPSYIVKGSDDSLTIRTDSASTSASPSIKLNHTGNLEIDVPNCGNLTFQNGGTIAPWGQNAIVWSLFQTGTSPHGFAVAASSKATSIFLNIDNGSITQTSPAAVSVVLSQVSVSGGTVTYTGVITGGTGNLLAGQTAAITGFSTGGNNVSSFAITSSTGTTLVGTTTTQANETHVAAAQINFSAPGLIMAGSYSSAIADITTIQNIIGVGTTPTSVLTISNSGANVWGGVSISGGGFKLAQPIAATSIANQNSNTIVIEGNVWTGSVSESNNWTIQNVINAGTLQGQTLTFTCNLSNAAINLAATVTTGELIANGIFTTSIEVVSPTATNIGNGSSGTMGVQGSWWNGAAAVGTETSFQEVVGAGTNPSQQTVLSNTGAHLWLGLAVSGILTANTLIEANTHTPSSATDTGTTGQIAWDTGFIYICTATNTWKRVAISTWP